MTALLNQKWFNQLMAVVAFIGIVIIGFALVIFFRVPNANENYYPGKGLITEYKTDPIDTASVIVTISWEFAHQRYQATESSPIFRQFNYAKGDTIAILVNPDDPNDTVLPASASHMTELAWRIAKVGITLVMITIGAWSWKKYKT